MRLTTLALALVLASPLQAQSFMGDMHRDLNEVQKKFIDLANAIPESAYGWKPGSARTVGEVLLHVGSDNYLLPIFLGAPAPAATGITSDFSTAATFEKRKLSKAEIVAELQASFVHLHRTIGADDSNLNETIKMFGQDFTRRRAVILTVTHLHEHLGQLIAYARANNVTPPWSR
ncbi:MAG TPA: DinB family protein [Gemmatimonadaceae bacterium]|nr:DinB family protein [Gemmatimonadaceae bacterium]